MPADSLTVVDRNYLAAGTLLPLAAGGPNPHWLVRSKKNTRYRAITPPGPGDALVELTVSRDARRADPTLPVTWWARALTYRRAGHTPQVLFTSLLDPVRSPATKLVALCQEH